MVPPTCSRGRGRDLFAAAERLDLEGIVANLKAEPYAELYMADTETPTAIFVTLVSSGACGGLFM
jgi:hypothetical protein